MPEAASALLIAGLAAAAPWWRRSRWLALLSCVTALYTGLCVLCFVQSRELVPLAGPLASAFIGTLAGLAASWIAKGRSAL